MRKNNSLIYIIPIIILLGTALYCTANTQENKESHSDIIGYWQEYIINGSSKEKTSIRKITLNDEGNLTQSITYEMATQCRIWLNWPPNAASGLTMMTFPIRTGALIFGRGRCHMEPFCESGL